MINFKLTTTNPSDETGEVRKYLDQCEARIKKMLSEEMPEVVVHGNSVFLTTPNGKSTRIKMEVEYLEIPDFLRRDGK